MSELQKTSLLIIATIFTATGASVLSENVGQGIILLLLAVATLILRGWLKKKGFDIASGKAR